MTEKNAYQALLRKVQRLDDLVKTSAVLWWDMQVSMPSAGSQGRASQLATLSEIIHTEQTSAEMGELIAAAAEEMAGADYDSTEASLVRYLQRDYEKATKLPAEFVSRVSEISSQAHVVWEKARTEDDFSSFAPFLDKIISLGQEAADYYGYEDEAYDALLDDYEPGMRTADVREIFEAAREALVPLRRAIEESGRPVDDDCLHQSYDVDKQQQYARYLTTVVGYDLERGHLGTAAHPFSTDFNQNDVRITARWYPDFISPSVFGTLHESGHALYEQNTGPELARTPLAAGAWLGFHESQSRLVENMIGRSRGFWRNHFPKLQKMFPEQLGNVDVDTFFRAVNKVEPSLIRVEADELTYILHIILRFELEQAMVNGDLLAKDVPAAWNDKMQTLLGITPPTDREGCLQDVHWSGASFGYFPTYALGSLYAAQLFEAAKTQVPQVDQELAQGRTDSLMTWMKENVHRHGRKYLPAELMMRATGRPLDHQAFVRYATTKFSEVYEL